MLLEMDSRMRFKRQSLPVGDEQIPVLVASEGEQPKAVFMSYESFLELAATLYTAIEALKTAGIDPAVLASEDEEDDEEAADEDGVDPEFSSWDEGFSPSTPHLRLVVGG